MNGGTHIEDISSRYVDSFERIQLEECIIYLEKLYYWSCLKMYVTSWNIT